MKTSTDQIELRWSTPTGRLNAHAFRRDVGFALGSAARDRDWGWLFNDKSCQASGGSVATIRFFTGGNSNGTFAGIRAVGDDACAKLSESLPIILPAVRGIPNVSGHPDVRYDKVWWKPADFASKFRVHTLVLNRVKGNQTRYDELRADPKQLEPFIKEAIALGLDRMAERIELPLPSITPEDIEVLSIGNLSAQPVGPAGRGMRSRLTSANVKIPIRLQGDWRVGGLISYGNGGIAEVVKEKHWRSDEGQMFPHPKYPRQTA